MFNVGDHARVLADELQFTLTKVQERIVPVQLEPRYIEGLFPPDCVSPPLAINGDGLRSCAGRRSKGEKIELLQPQYKPQRAAKKRRKWLWADWGHIIL